MAMIEVNNVTKTYQLGQLAGIKDSAKAVLAKLVGKPQPPRREAFKALDNVSFEVDEGEVVGIIGHNGAGKSTLLKILSQVCTPTAGSINVKGKVAPLIEVGAGLIGDLTGRENIFLNGSILGIPRREISKKLDEIVSFSELEEFIDTPVKRYSSGMTVKLGFSIATSLEADVLIVDEVLAVGDLAFQRKCFDRMEDQIRRQGKTVLLVSHNIRQVQRLCSRVLMLSNGKVYKEGKPEEVCHIFYEKSDEKIRETLASGARLSSSSGEMQLVEVYLVDQEGKQTEEVGYGEKFSVCFKVNAEINLRDVTFGFGIHTTDFLYLATHNSEQQLAIEEISRGEREVRCDVARMPLLPGVYSIRFGVTAGAGARTVFYGENLLNFQVVSKRAGDVPVTSRGGFLALDAYWHV
ncbi:MAG TPA: ABC transporter ATP-binding protein [Gammaproteobacteria bacterium]|nr:ABC transporter ATP-binding protein [Gammaproteobacteria bacterium]